MRLLLDAHISGRRVGRALAEFGHDVRAADEEEDLLGLEDTDLLALATSEGRILVTFDVKDFLPLLVERTAVGNPHAGCILVPSSYQHEHFGPIIAGIEGAIGGTRQEDWVDRVEWLESRRRT
ncbi:MAG: DUF5615 family PIN-like protein [Actinomycetota bacterium]|nr:DUF5615 family PIN-like protein [Actinomycetota bacterium]